MKNFKFGIKLWSINLDLIDQAVYLIDNKIFDYIELFVVPDTEISPFIIDVPYIIHIAHDSFGVNIGTEKKRKYNLEKINESITWADELKAKYLILHTGYGSMHHAGDILHEITDNRILIENMPMVGLNEEKMIGYSPSQIEELIGNNNLGLCLDFGHAVKAALSLGIDYKEYIKLFLGLQPKVFHISDGMLNNEKDEHLDLGDGEYDYRFMLECVMKNSSRMVTLETPRKNLSSFQDDLGNLRLLKKVVS